MTRLVNLGASVLIVYRHVTWHLGDVTSGVTHTTSNMVASWLAHSAFGSKQIGRTRSPRASERCSLSMCSVSFVIFLIFRWVFQLLAFGGPFYQRKDCRFAANFLLRLFTYRADRVAAIDHALRVFARYLEVFDFDGAYHERFNRRVGGRFFVNRVIPRVFFLRTLRLFMLLYQLSNPLLVSGIYGDDVLGAFLCVV